MCGSRERERSVPAGVGGGAQPTAHSEPLEPGPRPQTPEPLGWPSIPHLFSPLSPSQIVSDFKTLCASCKVIQLLLRVARLSPNSLGEALVSTDPMYPVLERPYSAVAARTAVCPCADSVWVSIPLLVLLVSKSHFPEAGGRRRAGVGGARGI